MNESKKTFKRARVTTSRTVLRLYYPVQLSKIEHEERDFADDICRFFQLEQFYMEGMMLLYMRAKQYLLTPFRYNLIAAFTVYTITTYQQTRTTEKSQNWIQFDQKRFVRYRIKIVGSNKLATVSMNI
jgi:hypothetical protein